MTITHVKGRLTLNLFTFCCFHYTCMSKWSLCMLLCSMYYEPYVFFPTTVCTSAVRNCLECRHRYNCSGENSPVPPSGRKTSQVSDSSEDPIQALINGTQPSSKVGQPQVRCFLCCTQLCYVNRALLNYLPWYCFG